MEKRNPSTLLLGILIGAALVVNSMEFPQREKWNCLMTPSFHFWEYIQRNAKHCFERINAPLCSICSVIYNRQDLEGAQVPISRWVDKEAVVHLHNGVLLGHKKKEILPFVTAWVDLERIMLSEISQSEKDKYPVISFICRI